MRSGCRQWRRTPHWTTRELAPRWSALADGRIIGPEAKALAAQAREAGMSAADVRRVHAGVIEAMRTLAERDEIITEAEARDLREAAAALGVPELTEGLVAGTATRL
jgi:hypothetical protein